MSLRQQNAGSIIKPGFNPLGSQTTSYIYYPYLYSWGLNGNGQLGLNNSTNYSSPKQVGVLSDWSVISEAYQHSAAVKTDGTIWTWGSNANGQLGTGNLNYYSSPKQIGALTTWATVSAGGNSTVAIKTDGTIWAWGDNGNGCLGSGNNTNYSSPKQIGSLANWRSVSTSYYSVTALKTDGTIWTWGSNANGQLGLGNRTYYSSPKQVGALTTWSSAYTGYLMTAAIKTDGTLWTWGRNAAGQLGSGTQTNRSSPVQVGALTTWSSVSCAPQSSTLAIRTDGTLWAWGLGTGGQLGLGSLLSYSSPAQVGSLTNWLTLATGYGSVCMGAIKTDGTLWTWGTQVQGQLGIGNTTRYSSPKQVGALTTWYNISIGVGVIATLY